MRKKTQRNKRQKANLKFKIKKRATEHKRKIRKEARKSTQNKIVKRQGQNFLKLPNSLPEKSNLIKQRYFKKNEEEN